MSFVSLLYAERREMFEFSIQSSGMEKVTV